MFRSITRKKGQSFFFLSQASSPTLNIGREDMGEWCSVSPSGRHSPVMGRLMGSEGYVIGSSWFLNITRIPAADVVIVSAWQT